MLDWLCWRAREYGVAGEFDEAERLLDKARGRVREDADRMMLARTEAEIALAQGESARALAALRALPDPCPPKSAPELLALRAAAEFSVGQTVQAMRTLEERGSLLTTPAARTANDKLLLDLLLLYPPGFAITAPGVSERERGWLELAALVASAARSGTTGRPCGGDGDSRVEPASSRPSWHGIPAGRRKPGNGARQLADDARRPLRPRSRCCCRCPGKQQAAGAAVRDGVAAAWFAAGPAAARPRSRYSTRRSRCCGRLRARHRRRARRW